MLENEFKDWSRIFMFMIGLVGSVFYSAKLLLCHKEKNILVFAKQGLMYETLVLFLKLL
jgi:hypothetical protein